MTTDNLNTASGALTIDLGALAENYSILQNQVVAECDVAGIVKANAYGLGVEQVVQTLIKKGCTEFFVATLEEALQLRGIYKDINIHVLGGLFKSAEAEYLEHAIIPVLNSFDDIIRYQALIKKNNAPLKAVLHFDTGMRRLGLDAFETKKLLDDMTLTNGINITNIMSHFACADDDNHALTKQQADEFDTIAKHFPNTPKSLANSSGVFRSADYHYNLARPGIALYGGNPTPESQNPMKNVVSLDARILQIRNASKAETVGYSATRKLTQDTQIATVACGYADGYLRSNSDRATVYWKGQACPLLGRVSMDLLTVDIGHISNDKPKTGDFIELLGANQTIDDLAESAGTISYEIITSLGARYSRRYING